MNVAEISGLTVKYGRATALNQLTVTVPEGCIGLLGPNGAGKSTLLKTLLGFLAPASGSATVLGFDAAKQSLELRRHVGFMPEQDCHIPGMSAVSFVAFAGELSGMPAAQAKRRAHEVLEYCGLGEARYRTVETYSTGMKQRIKFAQALVHGPKLLLLDEPTNGLDPQGRLDMLELVRSVSHEKGLSVIVSSHLLPDIERTCDDVVLVAGGELRASGKVRDLRRLEGHPFDVDLREQSEPFEAAIRAAGTEIARSRFGTYRLSGALGEEAMVALILTTAKACGAQVRGLAPAERSLEDVFLAAVGPKRPEGARAGGSRAGGGR